MSLGSAERFPSPRKAVLLGRFWVFYLVIRRENLSGMSDHTRLARAALDIDPSRTSCCSCISSVKSPKRGVARQGRTNAVKMARAREPLVIIFHALTESRPFEDPYPIAC